MAARNSDRPVGGGMYEKPSTGKAPNGGRPVGGGMYEKPGTGTTPNGDRPVGGGMYEKPGTGTTPNGDRPVGGGMYERNGTGKPELVVVPVPVPLAPGQVPVSYGTSKETGIVRVDDLPRNRNRVQNDCTLLQAKVNKLLADLARQNKVLAGLQGAKNVATSATATGLSTSFTSPEAAQFAIDGIQADIANTMQLLAQYLADLARCLTAAARG
ncbi:MAG: hypothetical protein HY269_09880 [Deltaproteobacteria bacterium]|nr:hypothetical protein [Deltaproteobacteria bacterium]